MKLTSALINEESIQFGNINLMVGQNNAGKSTLLKELFRSSASDCIVRTEIKWIKRATISIDHPQAEINRIFDNFHYLIEGDGLGGLETSSLLGYRPNIPKDLEHEVLHGARLNRIFNSRYYTNNESFEYDVELADVDTSSSNWEDDFLIKKLLSASSIMNEFCDTRLSLDFSVRIDDILEEAQEYTPIANLYRNNNLLKMISDDVKQVFGLHIGFDDLEQGNKPLRILPEHAIDHSLPVIERAQIWRKESPLIQNQGDGIRAYLKLSLSLFDSYSNIVFIDEPETFLHPPQRVALGRLIAKVSEQRSKQVFIATHDSELIRGLLNDGSDVRVFNLINRDRGTHSIVNIDLRDIRSVLEMRGNELKERKRLMNESIINSLFYGKTILTEDESDRMFYEYYASLWHGSLFQNKKFIGCRGVDEVLVLFEKLRAIGIETAAIVDIDFLFTRSCPRSVAKSQPELAKRLSTLRENYEKLEKNDKSNFKMQIQKNGLTYLEKDEEQFVEYKLAIKGCADNGIFVVPVGELESWATEEVAKGNLSHLLDQITSSRISILDNFMSRVLTDI